jgi:SAM-dependent methyltransferase
MNLQRRHFDEIATLYDESIPAHVTEHYLGKRVRHIGDVFPFGQHLLDVGCGTGILGARLMTAGYDVAGVDVSAHMLRRASHRGLNVTEASSDALPFADAAFDGAFTVAVLHHLREPAVVLRTIREMVRVVRPGGRVILWDHNPINLYWHLFMARLPQDDGSERMVGKHEILRALETLPLASVKHERLGFIPDFTPAPMLPAACTLERFLERAPMTRWFAAHNVFVLERAAHVE